MVNWGEKYIEKTRSVCRGELLFPAGRIRQDPEVKGHSIIGHVWEE